MAGLAKAEQRAEQKRAADLAEAEQKRVADLAEAEQRHKDNLLRLVQELKTKGMLNAELTDFDDFG